jgi:hypothetical protein
MQKIKAETPELEAWTACKTGVVEAWKEHTWT